MRQQRAVGAAGERGGVHHEHGARSSMSDGRGSCSARRRRSEGLVAVRRPRRRAGATAPSTPLSPRGAWRRVSPISASCQNTTAGSLSLDHEGELGRALAPVGGAEHRPELGRRQQPLEQPVAVLAQPQQPVAVARPRRRQGVGEPVHAARRGRRSRAGARRTPPRASRAVCAAWSREDVGQRDVVQTSAGRGSPAAASVRRHSSTTRAAL